MQSLSLLPFLLLATRGLLAAGTPGSWAGRGPGGVQSLWSRPRQPPSLQRSAHPNYDYSGTILTPDDSKCRVSVREQDQGIALKVDCSRLRRRFSCFFVGNPTACTTSVTKKMIYWRQIAQQLRAQVNMCKDAGAALSPRVCSSRFPEAALRLVYSTLINATRLDDLDSTPWSPSLTRLCLLLLAAQALLGEGRKAAEGRQGGEAATDEPHIRQPRLEQRGPSHKREAKGRFVTRDQAHCRWAVTEQAKGVALQVECTRQDTKFSCVYAGNPAPCLELNKKSAYWKQIVRNLRSQKGLCADARSVLKSRVCRKNFPESNLKLANSTLIPNKKPRPEDLASREQSAHQGEALASAPGAPSATTRDPACADDPDVAQQKSLALDYCGESWSSLCRFFLAMVQGTSC
ncbi:Fibroblast growth factor-binding protein 1 [Galemys pyrenaicus]|uniref:Fibroblast growth factor-binding protein 1 n=1 Tax=Galemys pyrenaicus TaxID=202257 RepID=A0A8J6DI31_GALPY|nr:Fibroblast growth factor-binding protein 1 [Galemys pyrenaicus]